MSGLRWFSVAASCALLLAACSKPADKTAASGAASAGAPAAAQGGGDTQIDVSAMPHPRAGAWVMSDVTEGKADPSPLRVCTLDKPFDLGKMRKMCSKFVVHRTLSGLTIESQCGTGKVTTVLHGTVTGDFQSNYTTDMKMTITLPGQPPRDVNTTMNYKYAGECTPAELAEAKQDAATAAKVMDNPQE